MTLLATHINLCTRIKQQANNVSIAPKRRDMKRRVIKQTSRKDSHELITEFNKRRQAPNLVEEALQIVGHTHVVQRGNLDPQMSYLNQNLTGCRRGRDITLDWCGSGAGGGRDRVDWTKQATKSGSAAPQPPQSDDDGEPSGKDGFW